MCGITGFAGQGDKHDLSRMLSEMSYRGPDEHGIWCNKSHVYLGHVRLSIVDLEQGKQPLETSDGSLVVVFNGEIYNHLSLRRELERLGHSFKTDHSDTEVLLHGYREWGTQMVSRLNGMWAFALLDNVNNLLWLSRDRFGKKPLFYSNNPDGFVFSSELRSLASHSTIRPEIDRNSLKKYFAYGYVPSPGTLLKNINKLNAGHNLILRLENREVKVTRYWRLDLQPDDNISSNYGELKEKVISSLTKAVTSRLQADVPVGVFLSGGIDSSAVAALAVSAKREEKVRSFSIGFEDASFDESQYSQAMADRLSTIHERQVLSSSLCLELLEPIYSRLDEPIGDSSLVPSFLMCNLASKYVTVAIGGDGSDELFAGYDPFRAVRLAKFYSAVVPSASHNAVSWIVNRLPVFHHNMSLEFKIKKFLSGLNYTDSVRNPIWLGPLTPDYLSQLFGEDTDQREVYSEAIDAWEYSQNDNDIDRTLQFYTELYLQNDILTKMDRAAMLNSIEVRSPYLDIDFVNLVRRIPPKMKFNGVQTKKILKDSLTNILPQEIIHRKKKGFGMPIGKWFEDQTLSIDASKFSNYLDADIVRKISNEHISGKSDWRSFLWAYHSLEQWHDQPIFCGS